MIIKTRKISTQDLRAFAGAEEGFASGAKRQLRQPLLKAFDVYKSNVYYGVIAESLSERNVVMQWYKDLCDLQDGAFENVPDKIQKYV